MTNLRNFAIVALIALAALLLPGGGAVIEVVLGILSIAFFTLIALLGYRLYMQYRFTLDSLSTQERLVLYSSVALAFLTFAAAQRLFGEGGVGVLAWLALLGLASYGVFWVWRHSQQYG